MCFLVVPEKAAPESSEMTSLPTPSAHQFTSDTQMEQIQLFSEKKTAEISRMPPDGHEFPANKISNGFAEKPARRFVNKFIPPFSVRFIVLCACAIVLLRWPKIN